MRRRFFLVLIATVPLLCSVGHADAPKPDRIITIDNFIFTPNELAVGIGTKVTWINRDDVPHTIVTTGATTGFRSPPLDTDDRFSITLDRAGTYRYFCSIHPMMTGTIVVR